MADEDRVKELYRRLEEVCTQEFHDKYGVEELSRQRKALIWELRMTHGQTYTRISKSARVTRSRVGSIVKRLKEDRKEARIEELEAEVSRLKGLLEEKGVNVCI